MLALPLFMTALSLAGVASSLGLQPVALAAWLAAAAGAGWLASSRPAPAGARYEAARAEFDMRGSWIPMALILAIFAVKYAAGAALAIRPGLAASAAFAAASSALYGAMSGIFIGRALRLWTLVRGPARASA
jgi:hypothetical protein